MLKNEIDVLVVAHNICVSLEYISASRQEVYLNRLKIIQRDVVREARLEMKKVAR